MGAKVLSAEAVITRSYKVAGFRVSQARNSDYSLKTSKPAFAGQGSLSAGKNIVLFRRLFRFSICLN